MALSLADIDTWDPAAIDQVFAAAIARASGAQTTGDTVGNLLQFVQWDGQAANAARDSANRIKITLGNHADQCRRIAAAAKHASSEIADLKYRLSLIRADAADAHIGIDSTTGALTPHTAGLTPSQLKDQQDMLRDLEERIRQLLVAADIADQDLALAIATADGAASGETVSAPLPPPPPDLASPDDVHKWWESLTPRQREEYIAHAPGAVDRDGIPIDVRDAANRIRLPDEIAAAKAALDQSQAAYDNKLRHSTGGRTRVPPDRTVLDIAQARYNDLLGIQSALYPKNQDGTPKPVDPADRRSLILLDTKSNPRHVFGAIGVGDVDDANHIGVTVGGVSTNASSLPGMADEATNLRHTTREILVRAQDPNPDSVATIAWVGYEPPAGMEDPRVVTDALARTAAPHLNNFFNGLAATTENAHQQITAFGHSYGSLVTSLALQDGSPVQNVVFYGSPGLELAHASDLHLAPGGHAYYEQTPDDPITWVQTGSRVVPAIPIVGTWMDWLFLSGDHNQPFGDTPNEMPEITQLSTSAGPDPMGIDPSRSGASGHSQYPRDDGDTHTLRMSGYNLAAVLSGVPGATKTGK
jgi:Alpha/beta hydrolase